LTVLPRGEVPVMEKTLDVLGVWVIRPLRWASLVIAIYGLTSAAVLHSGGSLTIALAGLLVWWPPGGFKRREVR
jgi:hypothetical protein